MTNVETIKAELEEARRVCRNASDWLAGEARMQLVRRVTALELKLATAMLTELDRERLLPEFTD